MLSQIQPARTPLSVSIGPIIIIFGPFLIIANTIPTLTRPWIVPSEIIIRESPEGAYIYKATLKVMLEEDYLKSPQSTVHRPQYNFSDSRLKELNEYSTQLIKETIIPTLTYAVNTSKRYAPLRQVYYSLILAQWFKARYRSLSPQSTVHSPQNNPYLKLIDSRDLTNLIAKEPYDKQIYFKQYQKSFKDGEYNLSEPVYTPYGQSIRRYMSGGMRMDASSAIGTILVNSNEIVAQPPYLLKIVTLDINPRNVSASPMLSLAQSAPQTLLQQLAADKNRYITLVRRYEEVIKKVEKEIHKAYEEKGEKGPPYYEEVFSQGAMAAIKLKALELLLEERDETDITKSVVYNFLPTLQEYIYGTFLPIGTEIEIWRGYPYTKKGNPNYYPVDVAQDIWSEVLSLPIGKDGLIEFALPPSRSGLAQVAMIASMIKIGLIPKGWFSLHISAALPTDINDDEVKTLLKISSYAELIKMLLYTSDKRLKYVSEGIINQAVREERDNISRVAGKLPPFAIYNDSETKARLEYRFGDVVAPSGFGGDTFSNFNQAITFIQIFHSLMLLALSAARNPQKIENKFLQELLKIFDNFIYQIDDWKQVIPEKYEEIRDLFLTLIKPNRSTVPTRDIVLFRREEKGLFNKLEDIVSNFREAVNGLLANVEMASRQPTVRRDGEDLRIVKLIKEILKEEKDIIDEQRDFNRRIEALTRPLIEQDPKTNQVLPIGGSFPLGGIDFHALPIQTQQIKSLQSLSASPLSINPNLDFDKEWAQIQAVFNAGIRPSVQRLVEFSAAAASSPAESRRAEDVLGLIADTLRREEESQKLTPTDPTLKGLLSALEA